MTRRKPAKPFVRDLALDLPVLSRLDMAAANALRPAAARLTFATGPVGTLDLSFDACLPPCEVAEEIDLMVEDHPLCLRLERPILGPLLARTGHSGEAEVLMRDPELAGIVLEHLLTVSLGQIETDYRSTLRIGRVGRAAEDAPAVLRIRLLLGADLWDRPCAAELVARSEQSADLLRRVLAPTGVDHGQTPLHLPAVGRVLSPPFRVAAADLRALAPGDALLPGPEFTLQRDLVLAFSSRHRARVDWIDDGLEVTGLSTAPASLTEETAMSNYDDESIAIDEIPVTLSLELDRVGIPFSDLADLRVGSVVPFRTDQPQTVRVLANGLAFATADLIRIEDRLGVRITSLVPRPA